MSLIPSGDDLTKAGEEIEDHGITALYAMLTKFRTELIADLERVLDERSLRFRRD